jgi:hypothetical protein
MPRPKGSKKVSSPLSSILLSNMNYSNDLIVNKVSRSKKIEDDNIIPTSSLSEISGGSRVVVNPAVLRYLEQNRNYSSIIINKTEEFISMDINERKDDLFNEQYISINEFDKFIQDDIFSTEFLTTARLAEWILTNQQSQKNY